MEGQAKVGKGRQALAMALALLLAACSIVEDDPIVFDGPKEGRIVNLYSPMEKSSPDAENVARTAADLTVAMAEEELGVSVDKMKAMDIKVIADGVEQELTAYKNAAMDAGCIPQLSDPNVPLEETAEALNIMKKAGKIRYVGLSNFSQADVEQMMEYISVDCKQGLYNMLERNPGSYHGIPLEYRTEKEVFPNVRKYGQAFLPYSPLFQGLLAGRFLDGLTISARDIRNENPKLTGEAFKVYQDGARKLKAYADEIGRPMNEMALNWLRQKEEITSIIGGASSVEQLEKNLRCISWDLTGEELEAIGKILKPFKDME